MKVKQSTYLIGIVLFLLFNGFTCRKLCRCKIKWIWKNFRTKMQMFANPVLKTTRNDLFWNCSYSAYMAMTSTLNLSVYDSACFVFLLWSHIKCIPRHKQLKSGTERIKNKWIKVIDILLNVWFREIIESIRIIHYYKLQILTHCEFEWIIPEHMLFVLLSEQKQCVDVWVNCIAFPTRKNHNKCEL